MFDGRAYITNTSDDNIRIRGLRMHSFDVRAYKRERITSNNRHGTPIKRATNIILITGACLPRSRRLRV